MKTNKVSGSKGNTTVQWAVTILCNMSLLTYGLQCGWMSPMTKILQSKESPTGRPLTDGEISLIASAPSLSGTVGVLIFLYLVDIFGRKKGIMLMTIFQALTWIITMLPPTTTSLIIARVFCGVAGGGCFHVVPMYVKEIAQDSIRGTLASVFALAQSAGILLMYALGGFLDYYMVLWIVVGIPVLTFGLFLKAPESPAYLVKEGKLFEAGSALALLRGLDIDDEEIKNEMEVLNKDNDYFKSIPKISIVTVFKNEAWREAFIIMIFVILTHATNGGFSILNYAATLLSDSDVKISPELQSLSLPICMTVGSLVVMATVDKLGRKPILAITFGISAFAFTCLASSLLLKRHGWATPGWLNVAMMMIIVCCYGGGVSPIPFIVMPEIFHFQIRAKLMGYLVMTAWFMSFVQLLTFGVLASNYGPHICFYIFTIINVLGASVAVVILPETKGKSVEQIEKELTRQEKKFTVRSIFVL